MSVIGRSTQGLFPQDEGSQGAVCMINVADMALDAVWKPIKIVGAKGLKSTAHIAATGIKSAISNIKSTDKDLADLAKNGEKIDSIHVDKKDAATFRTAFKDYGVEFAEKKSKDGVDIFFKSNDYDRVKPAVDSVIKDLNSQKDKQSVKGNPEKLKDINETLERVTDIKNQIDLQSLISQGKELNSIDIEKTDLKELQQLCKKYGVEIAVVQAADKSYHVFFKAQDYTRLEAALKDIGFELDKKLGKTKEDIEIVYAENNIQDRVIGEEYLKLSNDSHIQRPGEERKRLPMKEQINEAKVQADKINKQRQKQQAKNRSRKRHGKTKGGAR